MNLKTMPEIDFFIPGIDETNQDWRMSKFTIEIKRSSKFYTHLFVYPILFILFIAMSLFILPAACTERVTMGVLLILSLVIISLMLDTFTPTGSTTISIIGRLIGFTMFMVTWSTVASTLIIGVEKDYFIYKNIPTWLEKVEQLLPLFHYFNKKR